MSHLVLNCHVCDVIFKFNETKVAASILSKLRLKLGDKLLNVSQKEASMSKERQNYTLKIRYVNQSQQHCSIPKAQNQPQPYVVSVHRLGCAIKQNLVVCLAQQICLVLAAYEQQVQCSAGSGHSFWSYWAHSLLAESESCMACVALQEHNLN